MARGADDGRGYGGVAQDEGDRELDEADVGVVGELAGCFELALVVGQVEVEPVGQALAGD
jgi:hypothetical protein